MRPDKAATLGGREWHGAAVFGPEHGDVGLARHGRQDLVPIFVQDLVEGVAGIRICRRSDPVRLAHPRAIRVACPGRVPCLTRNVELRVPTKIGLAFPGTSGQRVRAGDMR